MKYTLFILFCSLVLTGCYRNNFSVSEYRLKGNKALKSTRIGLLVTDSLGADGFPARFHTEKVYEAEFTGVAQKLRTLYFGHNTRRYQWKTAAGFGINGKEPINGFTLEPGRWYYYRTGCSFGFLTEGACVLLFSINERGEIKRKRMDEKNDGPF